jgi:carbon monoxide dehydrogenase subunit G
MQFEHAIAIDATPAQVWDFLWDVERLARCIPGCEQAAVVAVHQRYTALIIDRVGPLKVKMPLELAVESAEARKSLHVVGNGKDSALGSNVRVDIHADLQGEGTGTLMDLRVQATVSGKIAGLGAGLFKRKFDDIMHQFSLKVKAAIEAQPGQSESA